MPRLLQSKGPLSALPWENYTFSKSVDGRLSQTCIYFSIKMFGIIHREHHMVGAEHFAQNMHVSNSLSSEPK